MKTKHILGGIAALVGSATVGFYANEYLSNNEKVMEDYSRKAYITEDGVHLEEKMYRFIPKEEMLQMPQPYSVPKS